MKNIACPHPFPYQGSKRKIAGDILQYFPIRIGSLIEPFCGAAAVSIMAARSNLAERIVLNDLNKPLMQLWREILFHPQRLADCYRQLWQAQENDRQRHFYRIREQFNASHQPHHLLYLLARIVKGSRYSRGGDFNQSPDNRRAGMNPDTMRRNIVAVSRLLADKATLSSTDFTAAIARAEKKDLVYMDPPYQGTSHTRDHRYFDGVYYDDFVSALAELNKRDISYIVSYDGITGEKKHGKTLPKKLLLKHLSVDAGRSSQSTLLGGADKTIESLYLSPALVERLREGQAAA